MEPSKEQNWKAQDLGLCTLVVLFLFAPLVSFWLNEEEGEVILVENRRAADLPAAPQSTLDWAAWPRAFESWHDDHFGLRESFVRAHNALMIFGLGTSPTSRLVIGRDHWVYTRDVDIDMWRGADPFSRAELEAWRRCLESRQRELAKRGIAYYFVLVPGKAEVYPEFLPKRFRKGAPTRTDQLLAHLDETSAIRIVDLRAALKEEKRHDAGDDFSYYPLGIHWTDRGAAAGARAIVRELAKLRPEMGAIGDTIDTTLVDGEPGDSWAARLYLPDLLTQRVRQVGYRDSTPRPLTILPVDEQREVIVDQQDHSLPRAVIFHDSFGAALPPLLGRFFSHSTFVWKPDISLEVVERERPDFVIQLINERGLSTLQPQELNAADDARVRRAYDSSQQVALRFNVATNEPRIECAASGQVSVRGAGSDARVACATAKSSDTFLLPAFKVRAGTHPIVRLEFESSVAGSTSILFQTKSDLTYTRRRQLQYQIHIGVNELYIEILDQNFAGRLMFRPAQEVGTFLISALEAHLIEN